MDRTNADIMIEADQLTKVYGTYKAVDQVSFACHKGEIVGFLGPNGAGKTTTMRMLTGYMPPTAGAAYIAGYNTLTHSMDARRNLGYLPETVPLYLEMTVENYLAFVGRVRRLKNLWDRVDDVLEAVDVLDRAESYVGALSKGMRQRVGLAQALLHDPDVLILDEPTIGLDPRQVVELRQLIKELGQRHTILLSTHILSEVEQICDRVIMVIDGRIWADMPMKSIVDAEEAQTMTVRLANPAGETLPLLQAIAGVRDVRDAGSHEFVLTFSGRDETRTAVAETAVNNAWGLLELTVGKVSLESVFLNKIKEAEAAHTEITEDDAPAGEPQPPLQPSEPAGSPDTAEQDENEENEEVEA